MPNKKLLTFVIFSLLSFALLPSRRVFAIEFPDVNIMGIDSSLRAISDQLFYDNLLKQQQRDFDSLSKVPPPGQYYAPPNNHSPIYIVVPPARSNYSAPSCPTGYIPQNGSCITPDQLCSNYYGFGSVWNGTINNGTYACGCKLSFKWDTTQNACVNDVGCGGVYTGKTLGKDGRCVCMDGYEPDPLPVTTCHKKIACPDGKILDNGQCITYTASCQKTYGPLLIWSGKFATNGNFICDCISGYEWNEKSSACEQKIAPLCSDELVDRDGKCITHDQDCIAHFGNNVHGIKRDDGKNGSTCDCNQGYRWNSTVTACVSNINPDQIRAQETALTKANEATANKFRGCILLQNIKGEQASRAWYVSPRDLKRYLIVSDSDLLDVVQRMARFMSPTQFKTLQKNPKKTVGYFIVVTNGGGEYFVNPKDNKIFHLSSYSYVAIREAIGIPAADVDLRKITVGKLK